MKKKTLGRIMSVAATEAGQRDKLNKPCHKDYCIDRGEQESVSEMGNEKVKTRSDPKKKYQMW